jgi:hypothetical protein
MEAPGTGIDEFCSGGAQDKWNQRHGNKQEYDKFGAHDRRGAHRMAILPTLKEGDIFG